MLSGNKFVFDRLQNEVVFRFIEVGEAADRDAERDRALFSGPQRDPGKRPEFFFYETLRAVSRDPNLPGWEAAIFQAAAASQSEAARAVGSAVQHLALATASLVAVLDPELIVLRGEFPHTEQLLIGPLRVMLGNVGLPIPIAASSLGTDAGLIGVALLSAEVLERELLSGA